MNSPAFAKSLIARRNANGYVGDVFVALGWPSPWLREFVASSPCARNALILATPERKRYTWNVVIGLSVIVWYEAEADQTRAKEMAEQILMAQPLRLLTLNAASGDTCFLATAAEFQVAA